MTQELIRESIGRPVVFSLAAQFSDIAEALEEIIDNPFDYRMKRRLTIEVTVDKRNRPSDSISVLDFGGEGMAVEGLKDFLQWGTGHEHLPSHIGQYHVGAKAACIYLADSLEIICRKAGTPGIYKLIAPHWGTNENAFEGGVELLDPVALSWIDSRLVDLPASTGFTKVTLSNLKKNEFKPKKLSDKLASTYRSLLMNDACEIKINGQSLTPLNLPESPTHKNAAITIPQHWFGSHHSVKGKLWVLDRDQIPIGRGVSITHGVRTLSNGRLITEGENFGHSLGRRAALNRFMGEIELGGFKPNTNKTNWNKSDPMWDKLQDFMNERMRPLINHLDQYGEARPISRELTKRTSEIKRDLMETFKRLDQEGAELPGPLNNRMGPGGRKPPTPRKTRLDAKPCDNTKEPRARQPRTPPPPDAVGRLARQYGGNMPDITYAPLGSVGRSVWDNQNKTIVINTNFPFFQENNSAHIVETIVLRLLAQNGQSLRNPLDDTLNQLDTIIWVWSRVAKGDPP